MTKLIAIASLLACVAVAPALILRACAQPTTKAVPEQRVTVCAPGTSC